jgi:hypothetical protein
MPISPTELNPNHPNLQKSARVSHTRERGPMRVRPIATGQMMLPNIFSSTSTFYLMGPLGQQAKLSKKASTRWISFEQASDLISQRNDQLARDLAVLRAAEGAFRGGSL